MELLRSATSGFCRVVSFMGCINGYFRNTDTTAKKNRQFYYVAKLHKEKKRNHEDDEAGNAGNDHRGSHVHPDPQSILG